MDEYGNAPLEQRYSLCVEAFGRFRFMRLHVTCDATRVPLRLRPRDVQASSTISGVPSFIGRSLKRREDRPLVQGHGQYAGDLHLPEMLHMAVVRSAYPHARLNSVDLASVRHLPGVVAAFDAADLPEAGSSMRDPAPPGLEPHPRPVLATDRVRYQGQAIAVVIAEDAGIAADAAGAVEPDLEPLPGVGDVDAAVAADAPALFDDLPTNVAGVIERRFGDIEAAFMNAAALVKQTFRFGRVIGGYMEPRATTASFDPSTGRLTIWTSTQWVFGVRDRVATALGLDRRQVRVVAPDVGGGFGAKGQVYPEEILLAAVARKLQRPVRWVATRTEDTLATGQSHGDVATAELAADADGKIRGIRVRLKHDVGAYGGPGLGQSDNILSHIVSAYRLPAMDAESQLIYTNTVPTGFIRGGGRELGNFIIERMMDRLAHHLGLDPVTVRQRNLIQPHEQPYATGYKRMGRAIVYDGGDYPRLLESALEAVGYRDVVAHPRPGVGVGVACCVESAGIQQPEPVIVRIEPDGQVMAYVGSTPGGQGHRTVFAQVVAEHLGWPLDRVEIVAGDSDAVPNSANTAGSRSALEVGNAAGAVARKARQALVERAQAALEASADDIVVSWDGAQVRGAPGRHVDLATLLSEPLEVEDVFQSSGAYTGAAHAVVLQIDRDTATVHVERYAIAHDCGQPINPLLVEGQLQGGLVHGLGYALMEHAAYQPDGTLATANFADYTLPGRGIPMEMRPQMIEIHSTVIGNNPEGFKGVGETGTIATPAAIVNALENALRGLGIDAEIGTIPVTPTRLFALLHLRGSAT